MYTWVIATTAYYRIWIVWKRHRKIQRYFLYMCLIQFFLLSVLIYFQPLQWIVLFLIPMITGIFVTAHVTYEHHTGLEDEDHLKSSYNITDPLYNFFTWNLGYHTAHHMRWSLHWSKIPEFHATIADKIEPRFYRDYKLFWFLRKK